MFHRIQQESPLRTNDFKQNSTKKGSSEWNWNPEKLALKQLFIECDFMVAEHRGFQQIYDLWERLLRPGIDITVPNAKEFERHLILV